MNPKKIVAEILSRAIIYETFGPYKVTFDGKHIITIDIRENK